MAGTWSTLANSPPDKVATTFLLTDGTVLAQGYSTNHWYRLTPDSSGDYQNGTWTTMADSVHGPLYYASGILRDGRLLVAGGEYDFGAMIWLNNAEIYDPVANTWTTIPAPGGWAKLGDAPGCVLPDGRFMVGHVGGKETSIYDPATNAWTAAASKINAVGEESWSLLPDGTLHAVDCTNPPNAEKYIIAADKWVAAGSTPQTLVDTISEIGASVLLPDGRLFVIGATGYTSIYTSPPIANQAGTWASGPTIPRNTPGEPLGAVDGPACLLPNGNVFFSAGPVTTPASFSPPSTFFEFDPATNTITKVGSSVNAATQRCFVGRMLMLPTGQVLYTSCQATVEMYTPSGSPDPTWVPTVTSAPTLHRNANTTVKGRQINGLSQCVYYGNDATQATNYPIVRLRTGSTVHYCRTSNFSTMALQTGSVIHSCRVFVPLSVPVGTYCMEIVANGISSACVSTGVTNKRLKELKFEIKEKLEIVENIKELVDLTQKRFPDIVDIKAIRENEDFFERYQDDWVKSIATVARQLDLSNEAMAETFIKTRERPDLLPDYEPEPVIEEAVPQKISENDAVRYGDKLIEDGRELAAGKDEEAFHEMMHNLWRTRGEGFDAFEGGVLKKEFQRTVIKRRPAKKKAPAKKTTAKKAPAKKAPATKSPARKKAAPRKRPPTT